jgi:Armadillo-like helical domain-containing protein 3, C-terminal
MKARVMYHWQELWRSLLGLLKFLVSKSEDLSDLPGIHDLTNNLVELLASSLTGGDTFLPGPSDYDDLFYKLVQSSATLEAFANTCTPFIARLIQITANIHQHR